MPRDLALRPSSPVLRRGPGELQFGTDPRWAVRLVGLDPDDERWVCALAGQGPSGRAVPAAPGDVDAGSSTPPDPGRRARLLELLDRTFVVVPRRTRRPASPAPGRGDADLPVLDAVRHDGAGHRVLVRRARAVVGVVGLGRLGATLATTLATAGVGTVTLHDPTPVLVTDVGLGGYRLRDVGTARDLALQRALAGVSPGLSTSADVTPDVVVVVEHAVADPDRYRELMGDGVAHLSVVVREADVLVGPFVRPGTDPCTRCLDLHRRDLDPCWPQLARQLRERGGPAYEETLLAGAGAALAAGQVLAAVDGGVPRTTRACLEIPAPDAVPRLRTTTPHPDCGCGGVVSAAPDGAALTRRSGDGAYV